MANYNSGYKYNFVASHGGFLYNNAQFVILVKVFETLRLKEELGKVVVRNILKESFCPFDEVTQYALHEFTDDFKLKDSIKQVALFDLSEKLGIKEEFTGVIVDLYLREKVKVLDEMKSLEAIIKAKESFGLDEIKNIKSLIKIADKAGLDDASKIFARINEFEYAKVTDRKPRKAISDFLIGYSDTLDTAYEWFLPLEMMIDAEETNIQIMPAAENTYIEMPYTDGAQIENTVYKNRFFNIVAWSQQGLTTAQKEQLKYEIAQLLDSTKKEPKKLTIQKTGTSFDVKYSGQLAIREGPSFIKASIPFELPPYGYPLFDQELFGSGLLMNRGDADVGFVNTIGGGCVNPMFQVGSVTYKWDGTVPINQKLVIDHEKMTCYLENFDGTRTNALDKLTGEFQNIPRGTTIQLNANSDTKNYIKTVVKEKILWK